MTDDDEIYIATTTLEQSAVDKAIAPEQRRYSMAQDLATHGAQIASLFMGARSSNARLASLEHEKGPTNAAIDSLSVDVTELKRAMRFLYSVVAAGLILILLAAWMR